MELNAKLSEYLEALRGPQGELVIPQNIVESIIRIVKLHEEREEGFNKFLNEELSK